jgi:uncharacterized protein
MRTLSKTNLEDITVGCTFLGAGGGGSFDEGLHRLYSGLDAGHTFRLMSPDEIGDDEYAAAPYGVGSTAPLSEEEKKRYAGLPRSKEEPTGAAFRLLEKYIGKKFVATIAGEIGPGNTPLALSIAAKLNIPQLDADTAGRAAPDLDLNTILAAGLSVVPAAGVTEFGDEILLPKVAQISREEDIFRTISTVSMGGIGVTDSAVSGKQVRTPNVLVLNSISHAESLGIAFRDAVSKKQDTVDAVLRAGKGYRLFRGTVQDIQWKNQGGYLVGDVHLAGTGNDKGSIYRIVYRNENLIGWLNDKPSVLCPDVVTMIDAKTGRGLTNPHYEKGTEAIVVGFPCAPAWRTPSGLKLFGPARFGYNIPYVPIEKLHGK